MSERELSNRTKILAGCLISAAWLATPGCGTEGTDGGQNTGGSAPTGGQAAQVGGKAATTGGVGTTGGQATGGTRTGGTATGGKATGGQSTGGRATGGKATGGTSSCTPPATGGPTGMNSGRACLSCHASRQTPTMTVAGTVYTSATGSTAVSGATVTIREADGTVLNLVTGSSGNFYTSATIAYPISISVSKCPDTVTMPDTATSGDCNSCHDSSMRIHLP